MDPFADIDLDSESVWLDGAWYTRHDLARRIKEMIETGDFRVSRPSQALERLEAALAQARVVTVRMPEDLADAVSTAAGRLGRPVGHLVREAVAYYAGAFQSVVQGGDHSAASFPEFVPDIVAWAREDGPPAAARAAESSSETSSRKPVPRTIVKERKRSRTTSRAPRPGRGSTSQIVLRASWS